MNSARINVLSVCAVGALSLTAAGALVGCDPGSKDAETSTAGASTSASSAAPSSSSAASTDSTSASSTDQPSSSSGGDGGSSSSGDDGSSDSATPTDGGSSTGGSGGKAYDSPFNEGTWTVSALDPQTSPDELASYLKEQAEQETSGDFVKKVGCDDGIDLPNKIDESRCIVDTSDGQQFRWNVHAASSGDHHVRYTVKVEKL